MEFTADQVWAYAVTADRINGGYVKMDQWSTDGQCMIKRANKLMVKDWLREGYCGEDTEADWETGRRFRAHFNSYTFLALKGRLNEFQHQALKIAQMDQFTKKNQLEFAIVSCLPDVARRDRAQRQFMDRVRDSEQIQGQEGDVLQGEITVMRTRFSMEYNKFKIDAQMGDSFVDFWFGQDLAVGDVFRIKGKIKALRGNKTTQLNYVKLVDKAA
jgi:hypothetical protein